MYITLKIEGFVFCIIRKQNIIDFFNVVKKIIEYLSVTKLK